MHSPARESHGRFGSGRSPLSMAPTMRLLVVAFCLRVCLRQKPSGSTKAVPFCVPVR